MKKQHTGTQIVAKLRQADVLIGQGKAIPEACKEIEVSEQTYYRWRQKYGGMSPERVKELRGYRRRMPAYASWWWIKPWKTPFSGRWSPKTDRPGFSSPGR